MRRTGSSLACSVAWLFTVSVVHGVEPLRFAWPIPSSARVEITDERRLGDERRSTVLELTLTAARDGDSDRTVVRFRDARITRIDGAPADRADPSSVAAAVARVMKRAIPTMVIDRDGSYLESRDLDRVAQELFEAAGVPLPFLARDATRALLTDAAAMDWNAWVGAWLGVQLAQGDWVSQTGETEIDGERVPVKVTRRGLGAGSQPATTRYSLDLLYPSDAVRHYTSGFLVDMARGAGELAEDHVANLRFLEGAVFSPLSETITIELETKTMRPLSVERMRSFQANAGRHQVQGRERRAHRFVWVEGR